MLEEANKIWKFLDELAANDPEGYKSFIENQTKEGRTGLSPPEPKFVIRATLKGNKKRLIINYCEWTVVPECKTEESPITVKCGELFEVNGDSAIALAFNPKIFESHCMGNASQKAVTNEAEANECKQYQLVWLGLHYLHLEKNLKTLESNSILISGNPLKPKIMPPADCYGSREQILKSLGFMRRLMRSKEMKTAGQDLVNELARKLALKVTNNEKQEDDLVTSDTIRLPDDRQPGGIRAPLIEEIPAPRVENTDDHAMSIPWRAEVLVSAVKGCSESCANSLKITFNLPGVRSGNQCELDMTSDKLSLQVQSESDKFNPLELELPCKVNAKEALAKFNPKRQRLVMTAPIILTVPSASPS